MMQLHRMHSITLTINGHTVSGLPEDIANLLRSRALVAAGTRPVKPGLAKTQRRPKKQARKAKATTKKSASANPRAKGAARAIVAALSHPATAVDVINATGLKPATVRATILRLAKSGELKKLGRGTYVRATAVNGTAHATEFDHSPHAEDANA
jgi:hypothetical protein